MTHWLNGQIWEHKKVISRHVPKLDFLGALISAEVALWLILVLSVPNKLNCSHSYWPFHKDIGVATYLMKLLKESKWQLKRPSY